MKSIWVKYSSLLTHEEMLRIFVRSLLHMYVSNIKSLLALCRLTYDPKISSFLLIHSTRAAQGGFEGRVVAQTDNLLIVGPGTHQPAGEKARRSSF